MRRLLAILTALAGAAGPAAAQDYLLRLDLRVQGVAYRGVQLDSVATTLVDTTASGTLLTPGGYVASCPPNLTLCEFYRPGRVVRSAPLVAGASLTMWRLGVRGLSAHASARGGGDLAAAGAWPGTEPAVELLEGYAQYRRGRVTGRLGRVMQTGRLGYTVFDGGHARYQSRDAALVAEGFAGLGLARAAPIPITSPNANPLNEFRPQRRQLVVGLGAGWRFAVGEVQVDYQREVDRETRNFVSERAAITGRLGLISGMRLEAGADYDIARAAWGTAEADLSYDRARGGGSVGVRRYRPYFDLWSVWGVFSPVGYDAVRWRAWARPIGTLELRTSGESFTYENTGATTGLTTVEDHGWRWSAGLRWQPRPAWAASAAYHAGRGAGAASSGWDGSATWMPKAPLTLTLDGGALERPLEYRYGGSTLLWVGLNGDYRASERLRFGLGVTWYDETRERPDAAGIEWDQLRLVARVTQQFGRGADRAPLPPAIRRRDHR